MSSVIETFNVHNHRDDDDVVIQLIEDPESDLFEFVEREWQPILLEARQKARMALLALPLEKRDDGKWQLLQGQFGAPDAHWNWREKQETMISSSQRIFALMDGESVEGLMKIDLNRFSEIEKKRSAQIVYVEYLAVAPWNRPQIGVPKYRGFGTILLGVAVSISLDEEMGGRCGLHSLPQSEGFYQKIGMLDLGVVDNSRLRYFEFDESGATKFLED